MSLTRRTLDDIRHVLSSTRVPDEVAWAELVARVNAAPPEMSAAHWETLGQGLSRRSGWSDALRRLSATWWSPRRREDPRRLLARTLDLSQLPDASPRALAAMALPNVRRVTVDYAWASRCGGPQAALEALAKMPWWSRIASLDMSMCGLDDAGLIAWLRGLQHPLPMALHLGGNPITARALKVLAEIPAARSLRRLNLSDIALTQRAGRALHSLVVLQALHVTETALKAPALEALRGLPVQTTWPRAPRVPDPTPWLGVYRVPAESPDQPAGPLLGPSDDDEAGQVEAAKPRRALALMLDPTGRRRFLYAARRGGDKPGGLCVWGAWRPEPKALTMRLAIEGRRAWRAGEGVLKSEVDLWRVVSVPMRPGDLGWELRWDEVLMGGWPVYRGPHAARVDQRVTFTLIRSTHRDPLRRLAFAEAVMAASLGGPEAS